LRPGQSQTESVFIKTPVHLFHPQSARGREQGLLQYAEHLAIELGYYPGNLPEQTFKTLKVRKNNFSKDQTGYPIPLETFNRCNEQATSRDEELLLPPLRGSEDESQQIVRTVVENARIPYEEKAYQYSISRIDLPDLGACAKVEIQYKPSTLHYFFPFAFQQRLLSLEELTYLRSEETIVVEDANKLRAFANDISKASTKVTYGGALIERYRSRVDVICSYVSKRLMSFFIYNDDALGINGDVLPCLEGFPSLKILTPQIQAIDLRMRCAANLKNQWYRLRFYNLLEAMRQNDPSIRKQTLYPTPTHWCDEMLRPYPHPVFGGMPTPRWNPKAHLCPSAGEGRNHYAMNPDCKPDSPVDMVLLFETKAGWNQQGGPELFTFDNHDPKGGCVLLNDGTVKFIRTKEELQQLRW
jgi:hypothetical protein